MGYFYKFLEKEEPTIAHLLKELEQLTFRSPRAMVTHSRTLIELILKKVEVLEDAALPETTLLLDRIDFAKETYELSPEIEDALHEVRMRGNKAAHDTGNVRIITALVVWSLLYKIMEWYVITYASPTIQFPAYEDPNIDLVSQTMEIGEVTLRLEQLEQTIQSVLQKGETPTLEEPKEDGFTLPGLTTVRTLTFQQEEIEIPYFLRDALLLPQRFENSKQYLIALNKNQEARFMSELPYQLDDLHERALRRTMKHTEIFVEELRAFIQEEIRRKEVKSKRKGDSELLLFFQGEEIVITEQRAKTPIDEDLLPGLPNLVSQLERDGITKVGLLPREFVLLGKYKSIGIKRLQEVWRILKTI